MNTVPLLQFQHLVRPHVPSAPVPMIEQTLRLAAIEFCERARAWRQISTVTLTRQGQAIVCPSFASIFEIENAEWGEGVHLTPTQYSDLSQAEFSENATPEYITQVTPDTVSVVPFQEGKLVLSVFLRPRHDREFETNDKGLPEDIYARVPTFLYTQHAEAISFGALARLFIMPGKDWSSAELSGYYRALFTEACDSHFTSNLDGQHNAPLRADAQWF